jgi:hypothetical protein
MSKYVMVDTVSMFRMRYCVEVPDDVENPSDPNLHSCTPEDYAKDTVTCEDAKEFTQDHLEEVIVSTREVTLEEALAQYRKDEPTLGEAWGDEIIIENAITPIGHSEREKIAQEEAQWNA